MNLYQPTISIYNVSNYTFGTKPCQKVDQEFVSIIKNSNKQLQQNYISMDGISRTMVEGIFLVHDHQHPHVLLLKLGPKLYTLPGGVLQIGQEEGDGLMSLIKNGLLDSKNVSEGTGDDFEIGEIISVSYRPNFDSYLYPYCPPHIKKPKEIKKTYLVHMPENKQLMVPDNMRLLAVPLFELHNNIVYGDLGAIPQNLSRFQFTFL